MSPLACSLLAFIALFVTHALSMPNPFCSKVELGNKTKDFIDFSLTVTGGDVTVPDKSTRPGRQLVGEVVSTCNTPHWEPKITPAIMSDYEFKPNFALFNIDCPKNITGCDKLDFKVTQYWEMVTAPQ
ncbi:uncharacterized protein LOC134663416 isoform X1 [Cydia fagiglandana]|uniref:uncharacterized protein LOC134663416 isoform X1 n=1 Tax=Cydia fagiglandana TaxID=1458189 RepID=UPI002FEE294C